eukprot:1304315-Amphidinium_carterae.1
MFSQGVPLGFLCLPVHNGGFRAWLDSDINTSKKMAGASERAGAHPVQLSIRLCVEVLNRAPFGAGRVVSSAVLGLRDGGCPLWNKAK